MSTPGMMAWTLAWRAAEPENFRKVYSDDALIFPPNKPTIQGNDKILEFMKGGPGKVDVIFIPNAQQVSDTFAFESGVFQDVELASQKISGEGHYAATWV